MKASLPKHPDRSSYKHVSHHRAALEICSSASRSGAQMPPVAAFALKELAFVSSFCPEVCEIPQFPLLLKRGNNSGGDLVFVTAVDAKPPSADPLFVLYGPSGWESSAEGGEKQSHSRGGFAMATCLEQDPSPVATSKGLGDRTAQREGLLLLQPPICRFPKSPPSSVG